jgi:uncharacterized RmlC-like cupin family protein
VSDIWVRYNSMANFGPRFNDAHNAGWYPAWRALLDLHPLVYWLMETVEGERLGGILITKLPPGGRVRTHVDQDWHANYYQKFYIALQNEPGAVFSFPERDLIAQAGDCFWFDNSVPHGVHNGSNQERLALIAHTLSLPMPIPAEPIYPLCLPHKLPTRELVFCNQRRKLFFGQLT